MDESERAKKIYKVRAKLYRMGIRASANEMDEQVYAGWKKARPAVALLPEFVEWDGRKFEFTGEYDSDVIPHSRNVAMRNRRTVWYPVYLCKATGERCVRADMLLDEKPAVAPSMVMGFPDVTEEEMDAIFAKPRTWDGERDEDGPNELLNQTVRGRYL